MAAKGLWAEFREFAFKGNMIELAVAVIIGGAFGGVINSLVQDIIMPAVSYAITTANTAATDVEKVAKTTARDIEGKKKKVALEAGGSAAATAPSDATTPAEATAPPQPAAPAAPATATVNPNAVNITWTIGRIRIGNFLGQLLNFLIVAFAVFITIVKMVGSVVKKVTHADRASPTTKECPWCLSTIPIKAKKCSHCTADLPPEH